MRFWDSSAVTPLLVDESDSDRREASLREDADMLIWYGTPAELESALNRRKRDGSLAAADEASARQRLERLDASWLEVQPTVNVRDRAVRLLRVHTLRAADAFQLAAALIACAEQTRGFAFHTNDARLREAAAAEGFRVE
ncbi:MAG: PIN domain-containing protein [Verrucomicrobiales bacterium]